MLYIRVEYVTIGRDIELYGHFLPTESANYTVNLAGRTLSVYKAIGEHLSRHEPILIKGLRNSLFDLALLDKIHGAVCVIFWSKASFFDLNPLISKFSETTAAQVAVAIDFLHCG